MRVPIPWGLLLLAAVVPAALRAQSSARPAPPSNAPVAAIPAATSADPADVDALVAHALRVHPTVRAAAARVEAARARIAPAAEWADPMLMAGIQNFPLTEPGFGDFMTMKMVGVSQVVPYPGKTGLRRRVAEREHAAAEARLEVARREVERRVRDAYYELAFLERALEIAARNQRLLGEIVGLAESRYGVGMGVQQDVLKARVEVARLADEAVALEEQRRVALSRLNETLDRASEASIEGAAVPERIVRLAAPERVEGPRFVSPALGARAADSPLPPLAALEAWAVASSPLLREQDAMVEAQAARLELAGKEVRPDLDLSLQYGQRDGYADMVSATVAVPLPIRRGRRQEAGVAAARADLAAGEAARHEAWNALRLEVARLHSDLERDRTQLALYVGSIIPLGRASLESATAAYRVGRVDLLALLDAQVTLYSYETAYHRLLTDFARSLADLQRVVGREVVR